jgi:hypothetical protein
MRAQAKNSLITVMTLITQGMQELTPVAIQSGIFLSRRLFGKDTQVRASCRYHNPNNPNNPLMADHGLRNYSNHRVHAY